MPTFAFMVLLASLWQQLDKLDKSLFLLINGEWTNPFFDAVLPYLRNSIYWLPLYLFLLMFATLNFKMKGFWWFVFFVCTVALTDITGTYLLKHNIARLRPCRDPDFAMNVRLLIDHCAGGYGFISNHAANHFGMAAFFFFTFRKIMPSLAWIGFLWAGLIIYAQVYVGVHYPLDVVGGGILGILVGTLTGIFFIRKWGSFNLDLN